MDISFNAKYPFSSSSKHYLESTKAELNDTVVEKGKNRAKHALTTGKIPAIQGSFGLDEQITSYVVARMLVSLLQGRQAIEKLAVAEAKRASSYLKSDTEENVLLIARDFGLNEIGSMEVTKYLHYAPFSPDYKLVNRKLINGKVLLSKNEFIRVLEEAIRISISESLPVKIERPPEILKKAAAELKSSLPSAPKITPRSPGETPPCIAELLETLKRGENLPHTARWTLTIYLLKTGSSEKDIIRLFSTSPDYDEKVTRYQVEYIEKKKYNMPSCRLIDSNGLCVYDCGIRNPLSYKGKRFNSYTKKK